MIFWSLRAFIWFKNVEKMLLQMTSGFLQFESTVNYIYRVIVVKAGHAHVMKFLPLLCELLIFVADTVIF
jgi:hypothetical protein